MSTRSLCLEKKMETTGLNVLLHPDLAGSPSDTVPTADSGDSRSVSKNTRSSPLTPSPIPVEMGQASSASTALVPVEVGGNLALALVNAGWHHVEPQLKKAWDWLLSIFSGRRLPQCSLIVGTAEVGEPYHRERVVRHSVRPYTARFRKDGFQITGIAVTPLDAETSSPEADIEKGGIGHDNVEILLTPVSNPWSCHVDICGEERFRKDGFRITGIAVTPLDAETSRLEANIEKGRIGQDHAEILLTPRGGGIHRIDMRRGFLLLFFLLWEGRLLEGSDHRKRLMEKLLKEYPMVLPVDNSDSPVVISFRLILFRIIELDERNQALVTNVEVVQRWNDFYLQWNPSDYGGIQQTMIPYQSIWIPDVILYNSAATDYKERLLQTNAIVKSSGEVTLLTAAIFRSSCDVDVSFFPFDVQNCTMRFMSWTQDRTRIQLQVDHNKTIELKTYKSNEEFTLTSYTAENRTEEDPCCENPFTVVDYVIRIKRRAAFFIINYVLPMVVINVIALLAFLMPSESGEKVTLGISNMLTTIIFLMSIRDLLPPTENIPLIGKFYCASICLVSLEVALSIVTLFLYHLKGVRVLPWVKRMCQVLAKVCCMKEPRFRIHPQMKAGALGKEEGTMAWADGIPAPFLFQEMMASTRRHSYRKQIEPVRKEPITDTDLTLSRILSLMETREKRELEMENGGNRHARQVELENWRTVSYVLDRFFLYFFTVINFAVTIGILLSSPYEREDDSVIKAVGRGEDEDTTIRTDNNNVREEVPREQLAASIAKSLVTEISKGISQEVFCVRFYSIGELHVEFHEDVPPTSRFPGLGKPMTGKAFHSCGMDHFLCVVPRNFFTIKNWHF
ncbi:unnamed protein product [Darwinula stevensoni]|uniref:Uncharacterized protein n=1 Tax=Darwinula stevensoni TaxID=69355 RepID=A0A7R8XDI5_9CRUS|nr:unnamed protein product [Darwinula stevensoni]CAG0894788.1 unnamed protein product [Darwinula stevensoni]